MIADFPLSTLFLCVQRTLKFNLFKDIKDCVSISYCNRIVLKPRSTMRKNRDKLYIPEKQICGGLWTLQGSNWLKVRRKGRGYVRKNRSTELEGVHSWVLPLLFKKISASPSASASILFSRAPSCCANEVKSDLPAHFLAPYLVMVWHAEKLTACAVLEMRSYNT